MASNFDKYRQPEATETPAESAARAQALRDDHAITTIVGRLNGGEYDPEAQDPADREFVKNALDRHWSPYDIGEDFGATRQYVKHRFPWSAWRAAMGY